MDRHARIMYGFAHTQKLDSGLRRNDVGSDVNV
jgi:hypothetical protein